MSDSFTFAIEERTDLVVTKLERLAQKDPRYARVPRPKRTRGKGTAKRRRKQQNKLDSLTKKLLVGAGAVVLGNAISNMLTKSNPTPITTPTAPFGLPIPKGPNDK